MPKVEDILKEVNRQDPRFSSDAIRIGSYYQKLKINRADEFDFNVPVILLTQWEKTKGKPAYYGFDREVSDQLQTYPENIDVVEKDKPLPKPPAGFIRLSDGSSDEKQQDPYPRRLDFGRDKTLFLAQHILKNQRMWKDHNLKKLHYEDNLVPFLVRSHFRSLVQAAIKKLQLSGTVFVSHRKHGPAVTINIKVAEIPHAVNVDLCPVVETALPLEKKFGFPHQNSLWPSQDKQKQMVKAGFSFTAQRDFDWRYSFVKQEEIMQGGIDADGGCRKMVLKILKGLAQDFWADYSKSVLTSYHLKVGQIILAYYNSITLFGNETCFLPALVTRYVNDNRNVCWKKTGLISKHCDGILLKPFPVIQMKYLQKIRM